MRTLSWTSLVFLATVLPAPGYGQVAEGDTVTVMSAALQLRGLLWRPESAQPLPAVLFLHGGGCADMDGQHAVGPRFASRGYVFLWLYRRGAGASRGEGECAFQQISRVRAEQGADAALRLHVQLMTTSELDDAMAGIAALRATAGVDPARIIVAGHSNGGQLAILAAERDRTIRAALNFSGAAALWSQSADLQALLLGALAGLQSPIFLGYARDDSAEAGEALGAELSRLGKVHELKIYLTGGHNFVFSATHPADTDVFRFLSTYAQR